MLWFKVLHIVGFVAWFAGIFYIWRLYAYHSETDSIQVAETLSVMERKLYKYIMRPAMVITIASGITLLYITWDFYGKTFWVWLKIFLVLFVLGQHFLAEYYRIQLLKGKKYSSKQFRILNEVPTLLLILIVILVIIKPFGYF